MKCSPPVIIYRVGNWFYKKNFKSLAKLFSWSNRLLFSTWLPSSIMAGKNFVLGYWGLGIVIHSNSTFGDNCQINQNVTIGRNLGDIKVPEFGNNVYVGAGSVIFGEITIGDNVIIGANSVVNKSIAPNSIVAGNPFKVIGNTNGLNYRKFDKK